MTNSTKMSAPSEELDQRVHKLRLKRAVAVRLLDGPGSIFNEI